MKPPSTARTAGRSDRAERRFRRQPFILLSFSSSKKARKAQETQSYQRFQCISHTDFNTSGTSGPRSLSCVKAGTHSPFRERLHTRAYTAKQGGVSDGGGIITLGAFHTFRKPCVARCQNGKLCRFWVLVGGTPEGHREPAEQRCAYARRCSAGVAAPPGCVIFLLLSKSGFIHPALMVFRVCEAGAVSLPSVRSTCC